MELAAMMDAMSGQHEANGQSSFLRDASEGKLKSVGLPSLLGRAALGTGEENFYMLEDVPAEHNREWIGVPAVWLDAMPDYMHEQPARSEDQIAAVNSDEAGLYRMFINHSP